tara:strand:+ start:353 stop:3643 length:3291 start_codon:yes stop_codon:yes gene_type:complete
MTGITQTVPSYIQGISEQPDELKNPGQLKEAKNVVPDITRGLIKRPGSKLVGALGSDATKAGCWFSYYRDVNEQYIGKVFRDGSAKVWNSLNGTASTIPANSYLVHTNDGDLQFRTINDNTYVTNRNTIVKTTGTTPARPDAYAAYIELKQTANARQYALNLYDNDTTQDVYSAIRLDHKFDEPILHRVAYEENGEIIVDGTCPDICTKVWSSEELNPTAQLESIPDWSATATYLVGSKVQSGGKIYICRKIKTSSGAGQFSGVPNDINPSTRIAPHDAREITYNNDGSIASSVDPTSNPHYVICDKEENQLDIVKVKTGSTAAANGIYWQYLPPEGITVGSGNTVPLANKKNLIWRFTVIGVSGPRAITSDVTKGCHYKCVYQYEVDILHGGEGWEEGDVLTFVQDTITYNIIVKKHEKAKVKANLALVRPEPTPFDAQMAVSMDAILGGMQEAIGSAVNVEIIGNGLYLTKSTPFNVSTPDEDLMSIITDEVNDVSDLPTQCKHGYIAKVANSSSDEDDYYLRFEGDNGKNGTGSWVECAAPGVVLGFDSSTMPIRIQRTALNTFAYNTPSWTNRVVGDTLTNPDPTFVGRTIDKVLFWRNRLVFLSQENAILSQPGKFDNFWVETALTVSPLDRIDLSCSSTFPTDLVDGIETNSGLMLFGENQQFLLTTDSDLLTPDTAKINSLCTYNYNKLIPPMSLGTTYAFLDNAGKYTRFFEMANIRREGEPEVLEQSKIVSRSLDSDLDRVANSRENSFVMIGKSGSNIVYGYRYFNSGRERLQQAWFTWELSNNLLYHTILDDVYYAVLSDNNLLSYPLKDSELDPSTISDNVYMPIHLDNWVTIKGNELTYDSNTRKTSFSIPTGIDTSKPLSMIETTTGVNNGRIATPTLVGIAPTPASGKLEVAGDWTYNAWADHVSYSVGDMVVNDDGKIYICVTAGTSDCHGGPIGTGTNIVDGDVRWDHSGYIFLGYTYEMSVLFPKFYVTKTANNVTRSDVHASLVVHRVKFDLGASGVYQINLKRKGRSDYNVDIESALADSYIAETSGFVPDKIETLPIYDRNINIDLYLKSTHPSPATLYSLSWEGDYSSKYYKRV